MQVIYIAFTHTWNAVSKDAFDMLKCDQRLLTGQTKSLLLFLAIRKQLTTQCNFQHSRL